MSNVSKASSSVKKKTVYRVKNWSAYNQALIARGSLTLWVDESVVSSWYYDGPAQRGAQYTYSDQAIEMALTLRRLLNLGLRQTQGFVTSLWRLMGLEEMLVVPDYSTLCRRQADLTIALPVRPADGPIDLVVDSAGLKVYGASTRRTWRKLHLGINADTQEIGAQQMTDAYGDDVRQLKALAGADRHAGRPVLRRWCLDGTVSGMVPRRRARAGGSSSLSRSKGACARLVSKKGPNARNQAPSGYNAFSISLLKLANTSSTFLPKGASRSASRSTA